MKFQINKFLEKPIILLIAVNILIGLFVYRDFGLTWDEPYFYSYGDALGYAYSPKEWFSGSFDLYNSYGISADDHKTRGPAYLFLARNIVYGVEALGPDSASAWHLVNFLFFQLGIYFVYRLSKRWMDDPAAVFASTFFAFQPLLWGHAFINPKDPPFLTFLLGSLCLGFEMVDAIEQNAKNRNTKILLASFLLGIATSIRVLGPLAGLLVLVYFLSKKIRRDLSAWRSFILYGFIAVVITLVTWPYLWENPIGNFVSVFSFMSDNPTKLSVLFGGKIYHADELPRSYFPFMLTATLTEPTWFLFVIGLVEGYWSLFRNRKSDPEKFRSKIITLSLTLSVFVILIAYVLIRKPSMYDGIRHFLFIVSPVFVFVGLGFQFIMDRIKPWVKSPFWLHAGIGILLIAPGILGIAKLHPYEYAYYNSFVGGTDGVFRSYETEYWLTCYKEAMEKVNETFNTDINLFVYREPYIADYYADNNIHVHDLRAEHGNVKPGNYLLFNTRTNDDYFINEYPLVFNVMKNNSVFCVVRQKQ